MATYRENLITRRNYIGARLAVLQNENSLDQPDANGPIDPERVAKIDSLYRELEWLKKEIREATADEEGGFELYQEYDT